MLKFLSGIALASLLLGTSAMSAERDTRTSSHSLFVWAGDRDKQGNDFLLVIDADPDSADFGRMLTSLKTDQKTVRPHHTEYTMPASGMLFANDHDAGRSFILDVRNPLRPKAAASFDDMGGFAHPHSYLRLPNGNVLATFQHNHATMHSESRGKSGGLVEIDDRGKLVRAVSNADPAFADNLLMPYSLAVLPEIDRVVSTNSSMHDDDLLSGTTYQVWRLSDLKLLRTAYFDPGVQGYAHISPEEPRVGTDGSVYVQSLGCGVERITAIATDAPKAKLVHTFPGNWCGVPVIVGRYFIQSVPAVHGYIALDLTDSAHPVEVSRLKISDDYNPHWTAWDPLTKRIVITPKPMDSDASDRMYLLKIDPDSGALSIDEDFRDTDGKVGFSFAARAWPHGWTGRGLPHGAVFSR
ncbi:MAG TPA: hypothetical protein PK001_03985 [Dokdonella sp.]|uniref:hypothetical protein n=1 Tax=Dokdonella sp. TaxID=2291710 RepID=UPI002BCA57F4|nr:hypothetical protein [Dokdonella sp.]HOX70881.1 hypothetical protein [Dokdonella sp.]